MAQVGAAADVWDGAVLGDGKKPIKVKEVNKMPAGDGTGPMGMGPRTGRAAGFCGGYEMPGYANAVAGRGWGRGGWSGGWGGRGWRHRNWYYATGVPGWARGGYAPSWAYGPYAGPPPAEEEVDVLRREAEWLQQRLEEIGRRIESLAGEE